MTEEIRTKWRADTERLSMKYALLPRVQEGKEGDWHFFLGDVELLEILPRETGFRVSYYNYREDEKAYKWCPQPLAESTIRDAVNVMVPMVVEELSLEPEALRSLLS